MTFRRKVVPPATAVDETPLSWLDTLLETRSTSADADDVHEWATRLRDRATTLAPS